MQCQASVVDGQRTRLPVRAADCAKCTCSVPVSRNVAAVTRSSCIPKIPKLCSRSPPWDAVSLNGEDSDNFEEVEGVEYLIDDERATCSRVAQ